MLVHFDLIYCTPLSIHGANSKFLGGLTSKLIKPVCVMKMVQFVQKLSFTLLYYLLIPNVFQFSYLPVLLQAHCVLTRKY